MNTHTLTLALAVLLALVATVGVVYQLSPPGALVRAHVRDVVATVLANLGPTQVSEGMSLGELRMYCRSRLQRVGVRWSSKVLGLVEHEIDLVLARERARANDAKAELTARIAAVKDVIKSENLVELLSPLLFREPVPPQPLAGYDAVTDFRGYVVKGRRDDCPGCIREQELVMAAIGEASMCWSNVDGAGTFDDDKAKQVGERLLDALNDGQLIYHVDRNEADKEACNGRAVS